MDQFMDLDSPATWVKVIAEKATLFMKIMPMAMENLSIAQHWNTLQYAQREVVVTNLSLYNLMLVILCISGDNLLIF